MKDLYATLGVPENADGDAIKKAYRKLAKEYHPDVTGGDKKKTERFKEINEAYGVLGEDKKRREYDRLKHAPVGADGMPQGFDPDAFAQVFGGGFRGSPRTGDGVHVSGGDFGDLGDLFSSLFGGRGGGGPDGGGGPNPWRRTRTARVARGRDMLGRLDIPFREAALGTRRTVPSGRGGQIEVAVPPGVETGGRLRVPGHGGAAPTEGGVPGDLHLEVVVAPDPHLRREGEDVVLDLPVTLGEAALGTKVDVPTIEGSLRVTIPPGTACGAKLRLRGKGIKRPDGSRGDQICMVTVVVPKVAPDDDEARKLIQQLEARTRGSTPVRRF
jgi:curved DNA-binding protein